MARKTGLPFVFARFSCVQKKLYINKFEKISKTKIKIPYYILQKYAKTRDLDVKDVRYYLDEVIYHVILPKKNSLKAFCKGLQGFKSCLVFNSLSSLTVPRRITTSPL